MDDRFRFNRQDFVDTPCCKSQGGIEGRETTHWEISVQQFLQHLGRDYELLPALPGFEKEVLRLRFHPQVRSECRTLLLGLIRHHLEKDVKSLAVLRQIGAMEETTAS